jgi:ribonuclease H
MSGGRKACVYTDGACVKNGNPEARAGIGVYWGENHPNNVSQPLHGRQTSTRAEIQAAIKAIDQAKQDRYTEITIHTDSDFLCKAANKWMPNWKINGWERSNGKSVINKEDFVQLNDASRGIKVNYEKVAAHRGIAGNEAADRLANKATRYR